ncbi:MAG: hypothetical protein ABI693_10215 [Bryobacteraceae bacterium]
MIALFLGATILLLAAAVVDRFMVRASASLRHLVWTSAVLGTLVLPLTTGFAPAWKLPHVGGAAGEILARVEAIQAPRPSRQRQRRRRAPASLRSSQCGLSDLGLH